ncbi:hypothetical protein B1R27_35325 [Streptomyces sp. GKU 895]|nr:hypothetical protein B1R27_35325 [Streptomyces sp. GKU 895]
MYGARETALGPQLTGPVGLERRADWQVKVRVRTNLQEAEAVITPRPDVAGAGVVTLQLTAPEGAPDTAEAGSLFG